MISNNTSDVIAKEMRRLMKVKRTRRRVFKRYMSWRWEKLDESWRYPKGRDNKARLQLKGRPPLVKIGYRTPKLVRYLHPSLKREVLVYRVRDLYNINPQYEVVRIASNVGGRKRLEIIKFAERFGIRVLNPGRIPEVIPVEAPIERPKPEEIEAIAREIEAETEVTKEETREEIERALAEEIEKIETKETAKEHEEEEGVPSEESLEEELKKIEEELGE